MTEKRFDVGNLKIQDNAPKGRVYLLDMQGGVNALCSLINGLNDKSNRLEKENEQLKKVEILANHRGEMISFANSLIDDLGSETMKEMWDKFKEEKYEEWRKLE